MADKIFISSGTMVKCPSAINTDECDAYANADARGRKVKNKKCLGISSFRNKSKTS